MAQTYEFYNERANEAAAEAKAATLENVRERALRSEQAWRNMAEQAKRVAHEREEAERERAARREAEKMALAES